MVSKDFASFDRRQLITFIQDRLENSEPVSGSPVDGDHLLNPDFEDWVMDKAIKPAAVLIPIIERADGMSVIFTQRTKQLKSHSGQVSFPGGKIDTSDANPRDAAFRETHEEIGVAPEKIELIGQMRDYYTGSGYQISPVIGMLEREVKFKANPDEVDLIFEVPLAHLMTGKPLVRGSRFLKNKERYFYEMHWNDHHIWGVTAGIVKIFCDRIFK